MAKSIRSKIKRKHRAEFRRTIGSVAYQSQMNNVQTKLQQNLEKQTMKSIDRLSETLMTSNHNSDPENNESTMAVDLPEASDTRGETRVEDCRGENKAPVSKRSRRKMNPYRSKNEEKAAESATTEKRRPKFFCQF